MYLKWVPVYLCNQCMGDILDLSLRVLNLAWCKCMCINQFSLKWAQVYLGNQCVSGSVLGDIPGQERGTPYGQHPLPYIYLLNKRSTI